MKAYATFIPPGVLLVLCVKESFFFFYIVDNKRLVCSSGASDVIGS